MTENGIGTADDTQRIAYVSEALAGRAAVPRRRDRRPGLLLLEPPRQLRMGARLRAHVRPGRGRPRHLRAPSQAERPRGSGTWRGPTRCPERGFAGARLGTNEPVQAKFARMAATLKRLWRLYHTPTGKKMFRYATVSVISTAVSFTVLGLVFGVFRVWTEVPSTVFANLVASVPAYYLNRTWSWGKTRAVARVQGGRPLLDDDRHRDHAVDRDGLAGPPPQQRLQPPPLRSDRGGRGGEHRCVRPAVDGEVPRVQPAVPRGPDGAEADAELFMESVVEVEGAEP